MPDLKNTGLSDMLPTVLESLNLLYQITRKLPRREQPEIVPKHSKYKENIWSKNFSIISHTIQNSSFPPTTIYGGVPGSLRAFLKRPNHLKFLHYLTHLLEYAPPM